MTERIVFAYSGSDGSAAAIPRLADEYGAEVVAMTLDLGQGQDLEEAHGRALEAGACRAHVLDVRDEFAHAFILRVLHAGAHADGHEPIAVALAQPLIGQKLAEVANIEGASAVAHHCGGLDRVRIEKSVRAFDSNLRVIACGAGSGRSAARMNLWGRAVDYDLTEAPPESMYVWTKSSKAAPDSGADVEIAFEQGVPIAVNAVPLDLTELVESLATIAGRHGVGRLPVSADAARPATGRRIHELPAAAVLHAAHDALEMSVHSSELMRVKRQLSGKYAKLVTGGSWFTPLREALDAFNTVVQRQVTGVVRLQLRQGECAVVGIGDRESGIGPAPRLADPGSRIPDPGLVVPTP
jgi:argininosuccinate synthase